MFHVDFDSSTTDGLNRVHLADRGDRIANLALDTHIGDVPLRCLRIKAWKVACIGVAVRVAILHVEQKNEVVAAVNDGLVILVCGHERVSKLVVMDLSQ